MLNIKKQNISIVFLFGILIITGPKTYSQQWNNEVLCYGDTALIEKTITIKNSNGEFVDTTFSYKAIFCKTRAKIGMRLGIGVSSYTYNNNTSSWLGNHGGPNFNLQLNHGKFNVEFKFKPWTVNPKKELIFNGEVLPKQAKLNPVKIDVGIGYSIDLNYNFSVEPYLSYSNSSFNVINEDELGQTYSINATGGFMPGITLNKYFNHKAYEYIALYLSTGYCFVDYSNVNNELDNGYFELTIGVAYKGYLTKFFSKIIE